MQIKCSCLDLLSPLDSVEIIFLIFIAIHSVLLVYTKHHINE